MGGVEKDIMDDLAHCKSLSDIQSLILAGKYGSCLKQLDNLKIADLKTELQSGGLWHISNLQGVQRVTLLTLDPTQDLATLNLLKYEVLDCCMTKGHLHNLLPEIPYLLPGEQKVSANFGFNFA